VHLLAEHYGICAVLHTDHANKKLIPWVDAMVDHSETYYKKHGKALYTSHMLDLSEESIDYNLNECARMLERMAKLDMSLEIELGITGGEEDGVGHDIEEGADSSHLYTQPEDVLKAYDLLSPIGHFSVAASFGNVHGVYKPGNVQLRPEILKNSQTLVSKTHGTSHNPLNLVFHGGSGSEKAKIAEALTYGVFKMNIDTDTQFAFSEGVGKYVDQHSNAFKYQIDPEDGTPQKKFYDPRKWLRAAENSFVSRLDEAFEDLGSIGRSLAK
jgi:fructose-bisphosphate aldolase class II